MFTEEQKNKMHIYLEELRRGGMHHMFKNAKRPLMQKFNISYGDAESVVLKWLMHYRHADYDRCLDCGNIFLTKIGCECWNKEKTTEYKNKADIELDDYDRAYLWLEEYKRKGMVEDFEDGWNILMNKHGMSKDDAVDKTLVWTMHYDEADYDICPDCGKLYLTQKGCECHKINK